MRSIGSQRNSASRPSSSCKRLWVSNWPWNHLFLLLAIFLLAAPVIGQNDLIVYIEVHADLRIPVDTGTARIFTKAGDAYDEAAIDRAINALCNSGYFEITRFERDQSDKGWIVHIYLKDR